MSNITLTNLDDNFQAFIADTPLISILGLAGNDLIAITTGDSDHGFNDKGVSVHIDGGNGNDTVSFYGGYATGTINGAAGNDILTAYAGDYSSTVYGGDGDDWISVNGDGYGDAGDDTINAVVNADGGAGADVISAGFFADGGSGDDIVSGAEGAGGGAGSDEVWSSDSVSGDEGNDVLFGSDNANGNAGHDVFVSFLPTNGQIDISADDFQHGEDRFATNVPLTVVTAFTGNGREVLNSDLSDSPNAYSGFAVDLDGDKVADSYLYIIAHTIEQSDLLYASHLTGNAADLSRGDATSELMLGRAGNDMLIGAGGDDWLFGGYGNDTLTGDSGNDLLIGSTGNDTLRGGSGGDELDGGEGKDVLTGGTGADTFVFRAGDSGVGGLYRDVIKDFEVGVDKIDISGINGHSMTVINNNILLLLDADGDGAYEMQVNVAFALGSSPAGFSDADIIVV